MRRLYWDTGLFICFLNKKEIERRNICQDILKHARDGGVEIYTSMWTMVEVIKPKDYPGPLSQEQVELIKGMFQWPWLKKVQVHQNVAFKAADLARDFGLKPADSIHAATAIFKGVDALQVFDRDFRKISHLVKVEQPSYITPAPLFDSLAPIGPTPETIDAAADRQARLFPSPIVSVPPSEQSAGDGKATTPPPEQPRRADLRAVPKQPPPDSSPVAPRPSRPKR